MKIIIPMGSILWLLSLEAAMLQLGEALALDNFLSISF